MNEYPGQNWNLMCLTAELWVFYLQVIIKGRYAEDSFSTMTCPAEWKKDLRQLAWAEQEFGNLSSKHCYWYWWLKTLPLHFFILHGEYHCPGLLRGLPLGYMSAVKRNKAYWGHPAWLGSKVISNKNLLLTLSQKDNSLVHVSANQGVGLASGMVAQTLQQCHQRTLPAHVSILLSFILECECHSLLPLINSLHVTGKWRLASQFFYIFMPSSLQGRYSYLLNLWEGLWLALLGSQSPHPGPAIVIRDDRGNWPDLR